MSSVGHGARPRVTDRRGSEYRVRHDVKSWISRLGALLIALALTVAASAWRSDLICRISDWISAKKVSRVASNLAMPGDYHTVYD